MIVGIPRETFPGELRVALVPGAVPALTHAGLEVRIEAGAGEAAGFLDEAYRERGVGVTPSREDVFASDVLLQVRTFAANRDAGRSDLARMRPGQVVVGFCEPLSAPEGVRELAEREVTVLALELMPRSTRAQTMDALSSQAVIAGYKAVVLAAGSLTKMFPKLTTAAGTIAPVRAFVVGAGVAGLQAIATARRLGAVVEAYDVRPAVREQVQSLGAKFVELALEVGEAEERTGYARAMDETFYRRQREMMARVVSVSDVVITTALVPGKKAPVLVTGEMVAQMAPGSVIVDLAAEQGGNCELTRPDEAVVEHGVTILGFTNLAATVPRHASQTYARNVSSFLLHLLREAEVRLDPEDEIARETLVARAGNVVHPKVREALGLAPAGEPVPSGAPADDPPAAQARETGTPGQDRTAWEVGERGAPAPREGRS